MNYKKSDMHNQNSGGHFYMQQEENQGVSHIAPYYHSFTSPQFVGDHVIASYGSPSIIPIFRHPNTLHPYQNQQSIHAFQLKTPQGDLNRLGNTMAPDAHFNGKNIPFIGGFYQHPYIYGGYDPYPSVGFKNQKITQKESFPIYHKSTSKNEFVKESNFGLKDVKDSDYILIESYEDRMNYNKEQKIEGVREDKLQAQKEKDMKIQNKKKQFTFTIQEDQKKFVDEIKNVQIAYFFQSFFAQTGIRQNKQGPPQQFVDEMNRLVPPQNIDYLKQRLLKDTEKRGLVDNTMKQFIKFKILQTYSRYKAKNLSSVHTLDQFRTYKNIVEFEKQRKIFLDSFMNHLISDKSYEEQIFNFQNLSSNNNQSNGHIFTGNKQFFFTKRNADSIEQKYPSKQNELQINKKDLSSFQLIPKTKKIQKRVSFKHNIQENQVQNKNKLLNDKNYQESQQNPLNQRKLRERKKKRNKHSKHEKEQNIYPLKHGNLIQIERQNDQIIHNPSRIQYPKVQIQLSHQDQGLIQKIKGWAQKTVLADAIEEKHKKSLDKTKPHIPSEIISKSDSRKTLKKEQINVSTKKQKDRSTKGTENAFKQALNDKILSEKQKKESRLPNLITFSTSNNISEGEKEQYQKQLLHLAKQLRNNESKGKIRIGKEYYQARMPDFIKSEKQLELLMTQKRKKLMERKMSVLTF